MSEGFSFLIKAYCFKKQRSSSSFFLPDVDKQVQNGHGASSRLVPCLKWLELGCLVLLGHFGHVYLLQVSKTYEEERYF